MEIREYVRTTNNGIKRIDTIFENRPVNRYGYEIGSDWDGKEYAIIKTTEILKHSKNIIDLIEVGDVIELPIGRYEVIFDGSYMKLGLLIPNRDMLQIRHCSLEYIFSKQGLEEFIIINILTHEQYKRNCYKVGD